MDSAGNSTAPVRPSLAKLSQSSGTELGLVVVTLLLAAFLADSLRSWHRLSHVPGPRWAALSRLWMVKQSVTGQQPYAIQQANEKYGSLVRIGPNAVATDDPEQLRKMMSIRSTYTRGPFYKAFRFEAGKDNLFSQRDEDAHMKLRNKMAAGYSGKENESMEGSIDMQIAQLVELLETKYISSPRAYRPVDFALLSQYFTLDVVSDLAFGQAFGYLEQDKDLFDFIKITRSYFVISIVIATVPELVDVLHSPLFRRLLPKEGDALGFGAFISFAKKKVAERFGPHAVSQPDMLGSFIRHGLSQEDVSRESLLNVVAGSDTSATSIRVMLLSILGSPSIYRKLQKEIDDGIEAGTVSSPITDAEARQLPYLQACIKETLRIKTPVASPFFKIVPPEGDVINGKFIPGGTQVATSSFGIYHSRKIFGEDAHIFSPERWLEADEAKSTEMLNVLDLVFSVGKYQCLGKRVALMEMNKVFVELMRRFDFALDRPERPLHVQWAGIWVIEDFPVRITRRGGDF